MRWGGAGRDQGVQEGGDFAIYIASGWGGGPEVVGWEGRVEERLGDGEEVALGAGCIGRTKDSV